ncbi:MAG: hypothetical protein K0U41_00230, partial [Gammaproteobacteria bacterium]|nr:hypothetical protein [Gammaproteobacteria bacterium]
STIISEANISWINPTYQVPINNVTIIYSGYNLAIGGSPVANSTGEVFLNTSDGEQFVKQGASAKYNIAGLNQTAYYEFTVSLGYLGVADMPASSIRIPIIRSSAPAVASLNAVSTVISEANISWINPTYQVPINNITIIYNGYDLAMSGSPVANSTGKVFISAADGNQFVMQGVPVSYNIAGLDQAFHYGFNVTLGYLGVTDNPTSSIRIPIVPPSFKCSAMATNQLDEDGDGCSDNEDIDADGDGLIDIKNADELNMVRHNLLGTNLTRTAGGAGDARGCPLFGAFPGKSECKGYELMVDIDLPASGYTNWEPIGNCGDRSTCVADGNPQLFATVFEGNNHVISNMLIRITQNRAGIGLFGAADSSAKLRNLHIRDANITTVAGGGSSRIGVLVGHLEGGSIDSSSVTFDLINVTNRGNVIGGLVGFGEGVTITSSTAKFNQILGNDRLGGLIGRGKDATIISSNVTFGQVIGNQYLGGLIGHSPRARIISSAIIGESIRGNIEAGGLIGSGDRADISLSSATLGMINGASVAGGLAGAGSESNIRASYAVVNEIRGVSVLGGLVGRAPDAKISSSMARVGEFNGVVSIGGLLGDGGGSTVINNSYAITGIINGSLIVGGLVGIGTIGSSHNSFWDNNVYSPNFLITNIDDSRTTAELQTPTSFANSIYTSWADSYCNPATGDYKVFTTPPDPNQDPGYIRSWDLGNSNEYPVVNCMRDISPAQQRAAMAARIRISVDPYPAPAVEFLRVISNTVVNEANISWINPFYPVPINNVTITYTGYDLDVGGNPVASSRGRVFLSAADGNQFVTRGLPASYNIAGLDQAAYYEFAVSLGYLGLTDMPTTVSIRILIYRNPALAVESLQAFSPDISEANISWRNPIYSEPINSITITYRGYESANSRNAVAGADGRIFLSAADGNQFVTQGVLASRSIPNLNQAAYYEFMVTIEYLGVPVMPTSSIRIPIVPPSFICSLPIATNIFDEDGDFCGDSEDVDADGDGLIDIVNADELNMVRHNLLGTNLTRTAGGAGDAKGCPFVGSFPGRPECSGYELLADVDLLAAGYTNWEPIGNCGSRSNCRARGNPQFFATVFEGNNHIISNMTINSVMSAAGTCLFGAAEPGAEFHNLHIRDANILLGGSSRVGGLVGHFGGGIINSSSVIFNVINAGSVIGGLAGLAEDVTITSSTAKVNQIIGSNRLGGLVGRGDGTTIISSNATLGQIMGVDYLGGLIGWVDEPAIISSNATFDQIMGNDNLGGLIGFGRDTAINSSIATFGQIIGNDYLGGLMGSGLQAVVTSASATGTNIRGGTEVGGLIGAGDASDISLSSATMGIINGSTSVGGLVGRGIRDAGSSGVTITASYAQADKIIGTAVETSQSDQLNGSRVGGLVGDGRLSNIVGSSAIVNEIRGSGLLGGIIGAGLRARVQTSAATVGKIIGPGSDYIGGLLGLARDANIISSYAVTGIINGSLFLGGLYGNEITLGNEIPILVTSSFWDNSILFSSGQRLATNNKGLSQSTVELQTPISFASTIYGNWAFRYCNRISGEPRFSITPLDPTQNPGFIQASDLGNSTDYPAINCLNNFSPTQQREAMQKVLTGNSPIAP